MGRNVEKSIVIARPMHLSSKQNKEDDSQLTLMVAIDLKPLERLTKRTMWQKDSVVEINVSARSYEKLIGR